MISVSDYVGKLPENLKTKLSQTFDNVVLEIREFNPDRKTFKIYIIPKSGKISSIALVCGNRTTTLSVREYHVFSLSQLENCFLRLAVSVPVTVKLAPPGFPSPGPIIGPITPIQPPSSPIGPQPTPPPETQPSPPEGEPEPTLPPSGEVTVTKTVNIQLSVFLDVAKKLIEVAQEKPEEKPEKPVVEYPPEIANLPVKHESEILPEKLNLVSIQTIVEGLPPDMSALILRGYSVDGLFIKIRSVDLENELFKVDVMGSRTETVTFVGLVRDGVIYALPSQCCKNKIYIPMSDIDKGAKLVVVTTRASIIRTLFGRMIGGTPSTGSTFDPVSEGKLPPLTQQNRVIIVDLSKVKDAAKAILSAAEKVFDDYAEKQEVTPEEGMSDQLKAGLAITGVGIAGALLWYILKGR